MIEFGTVTGTDGIQYTETEIAAMDKAKYYRVFPGARFVDQSAFGRAVGLRDRDVEALRGADIGAPFGVYKPDPGVLTGYLARDEALESREMPPESSPGDCPACKRRDPRREATIAAYNRHIAAFNMGGGILWENAHHKWDVAYGLACALAGVLP